MNAYWINYDECIAAESKDAAIMIMAYRRDKLPPPVVGKWHFSAWYPCLAHKDERVIDGDGKYFSTIAEIAASLDEGDRVCIRQDRESGCYNEISPWTEEKIRQRNGKNTS